jgi:Tfp pilus assembly protein PilZ
LYEENKFNDSNPYYDASVKIINETVKDVTKVSYTYRVTVTGGWVIYTKKQYTVGQSIYLNCKVRYTHQKDIILYDENIC